MEYIFVRHGEPEGCYEGGVYHPRRDAGLSEVGREQARKVGEVVKAFDPKYILSSDILRARETAECICEVLGATVGSTRDKAHIKSCFDARTPNLAIETREELREHHVREDIEDGELVRFGKESLLKKAIGFEEAFAECRGVIEGLGNEGFDGNVVVVSHRARMAMLEFCATHEVADLEAYKRSPHRAVYNDMENMTGFCRCFAVDLDKPIAEREITQPGIGISLDEGKTL